MKIVKTASGKTKIKMSRKEWTDMGKKAGWMKEANWRKDVNSVLKNLEFILTKLDSLENFSNKLGESGVKMVSSHSTHLFDIDSMKSIVNNMIDSGVVSPKETNYLMSALSKIEKGFVRWFESVDEPVEMSKTLIDSFVNKEILSMRNNVDKLITKYSNFM